MSNMIEMYARMIRGVDDLRVELRNELSEIKALKKDLNNAISNLNRLTYRFNPLSHEMGIAAEEIQKK